MTTLTLKKRKKAEAHIHVEPAMLEPEQIQAQIERLMARPVGFDSQRFFDNECAIWFTDFHFICDGLRAHARITDEDRAQSLDDFSLRIIEPMVARWRATRWATARL
jgi:hypothetical protein